MAEANGGNNFLSVAGGGWNFCEQGCGVLPFIGDCSPCSSGQVEEYCSWHPQQMSVSNPWSSAYDFCYDPFNPYTNYNKQCYCKTPTVECSGGADPGDKKCQGTEVWRCSNTGTWEYSDKCNYGCSSGSCDNQQCSSHDSKKCSSGDVYWHDSCGGKEEKAIDCGSDETCENAQCIKTCNEGNVGEKTCEGNKIMQNYQYSDCSKVSQQIDYCTFGCEYGVCSDASCPNRPTDLNPGDWSICNLNKQTRANFKCDSSTNFEWLQYTEQGSCECSSDSQCDQTEFCTEDNICNEVICLEGEIVSDHDCITPKTNWGLLLSIILIPLFILVSVSVVIVILIKRRKNESPKKN